MRIGFTFDLRDEWLAAGYSAEETSEFDSPATIRGIEEALTGIGFEVERVGSVQALASALVAGRRWDMVFNIAEGMHGLAREAQVPSLLDAWQIPYTFSDPLTLAVALHKGMTKTLLREAGVATVPFAVVAREADLDRVDLSWPRFVKPVAEGTSKGVGPWSLVHDARAQRETFQLLSERFRQPVIIEPFLSGREFTVGVLGTGDGAEAIGVMEVSFTDRAEMPAYSLVNKVECARRVVYSTPDDPESRRAGEVALAAWRALGCRDAGRVDVRSDANANPQVIEVNPLPGLAPGYSDLVLLAERAGISYTALIERIVRASFGRLGIPWPRSPER